ncbi:hypothetical protein LOD99_435 [Oopsacas minuta]|uniref:Protein kinase domain-containing protein n=1 Tax=Oopsacas minuta TaxID=111878 RepID=A0AAV7K9I0_9METZ|nr:hypothetical protein LOD99_435 [Oopsacas minuta]
MSVFIYLYIIFLVYVGNESNALLTDCAYQNDTLTFTNSTSLYTLICDSSSIACIILQCFFSNNAISLYLLVIPLFGVFALLCCCLLCPCMICICLSACCATRKKYSLDNVPVVLATSQMNRNVYENSVLSDTHGSTNQMPMSTITSSGDRPLNDSSIIYESFKLDGRSQSTGSNLKNQTMHESPQQRFKKAAPPYSEPNVVSPTSTMELIMANDYSDRDEDLHDDSTIYDEVSDIYRAYELGRNLNKVSESMYQQITENHTVKDDYKTAVIVLNSTERNNVGNDYEVVFEKVPDSNLDKTNFFKQQAGLKIPSKDISTIYNEMSKSNFREINRKTLSPQEKLSEAQFFDTFKGNWASNYGDIPVAIRALNNSENTDEVVGVLREAAVMGQFYHPNILKLFGVVTLGKPYLIVTELHKDQLDSFLFKLNKSPIEKSKFPTLLHKFCIEICLGMEYLSNLKFIHRDLASRNVLLTINLSCRIADFGMCCELKTEKEYHRSSGVHIPVRWTAPESIFYRRFSEKSDVWSFGMTMYEVWGMSLKPWCTLTTEEVVDTLLHHNLPTPPTGCSRNIYELMIEIWNPEPENRPTFSDLCVKLNDIKLSKGIETDPMNLVGNEPSLSKYLYLDLQKRYKTK